MHPRKLVRDTVGFAAAQYAVRAILMLRGVIAARLLGPAGYGAWHAINLVFDYGANATLGAQQGLDQVIPTRIADGDAARLQRTMRGGLFAIVILTLAYGAFLLAYLTRESSDGAILSFWGVTGVLTALACVLCMNLSNFHTTLLRSYGDIHSVSTWFMLQGAIGALLGLGLIPWLGAWGLLWGWLIANLVALAYARWRSRPEVPFLARPEREGLELLRIGLPIFFYLGSATILRTVDRIVVLRFLGAEALGYYGISIMVLNLLMYVPDSLSYVLYPQFLTAYRAAGDRPEAIRDQALRALKTLAVAMPALAGIAYLCGRDAVLWVLPSYLPGATPLRVMCFAAVGLAISSLASMLLMTTRRQMQLVPVALVVTALGAALDIAVLRAGHGIAGVAWATLATYVVNGSLVLWLAGRALELSPGASGRLVLRTLAPFAIAVVLAVALDRLVPGPGARDVALRAGRLLLVLLAYTAAFLVLVRPFSRGLGLRQIIMEFRIPGSAARRNGGANGA